MGWPLCVALAASPIYHILADILVLQPGKRSSSSGLIISTKRRSCHFIMSVIGSHLDPDLDPVLDLDLLIPARNPAYHPCLASSYFRSHFCMLQDASKIQICN